jgi:hypothetical protein
MVIFYPNRSRVFGIPLRGEVAVLMFKKMTKNSP